LRLGPQVEPQLLEQVLQVRLEPQLQVLPEQAPLLLSYHMPLKQEQPNLMRLHFSYFYS
jgi:hypothetical protein